MKIFGKQSGLTFSHKALRDQIEGQGWEVTKVKFDSKSQRYVAEAKSRRGLKIERRGKTEQLALSNLLIAVSHRTSSVHLARWNHTFVHDLQAIARAYSKAPIYEPKASAAFMELAADCERRVNVLKTQLQIEVVSDPEPYTSSEKLIKDVKEHRKLKVSRAGADHPIWTEKQVIDYRICHDVFGYVAAGSGWDWAGENEAFDYHVPLLPEEAQKALFTESIAQTAYATYYRAYGAQKIALFPQFMDDAQEQENPHKGHPGIHPSQTVPAVPTPAVKPLVASWVDQDDTSPEDGSQRVSGEVNPSLGDPNMGWQSQYADDPMTTANGLTIKDAYGDPLESQQVRDTASLIDREWAYLNENDPAEVAKMKQAIVNAFRMVILSPKKALKWNAIHAQDLASVPPEETNPRAYYDTINKAREEWNVARGHDRYGHVPYMQYLNQLVNVLYQKAPRKGFPAAVQKAKDLIFLWVREEQERIQQAKPDMPDFQVEGQANKAVMERLELYLAEHKPNLDQAMSSEHRKYFRKNPLQKDEFAPHLAALKEPEPKADIAKYQGFMNDHLIKIAQIAEHVDEILKAALRDVHEDGGRGYIFRSTVMQLGLPGISNKTASFAWLLLQPMTSELATIDVHIMDLLGHDESDMNPRDYYGYERMLRAARDASGYGHIPLGQFQWSLWDYKRTGPGTHQDHGPLAVLDPTDPMENEWIPNNYQIWWDPSADRFADADLNDKNQIKRAEAYYKQQWRQNPPEWWAQTQPAREQAWNDFQDELGDRPKTRPPYMGLPEGYEPEMVMAKASMRWDDQGNLVPVYQNKPGEVSYKPWIIHPQTGERLTGLPGQTLMSHAMQQLAAEDPREIWAQLPDEMVGKV